MSDICFGKCSYGNVDFFFSDKKSLRDLRKYFGFSKLQLLYYGVLSKYCNLPRRVTFFTRNPKNEVLLYRGSPLAIMGETHEHSIFQVCGEESIWIVCRRGHIRYYSESVNWKFLIPLKKGGELSEASRNASWLFRDMQGCKRDRWYQDWNLRKRRGGEFDITFVFRDWMKKIDREYRKGRDNKLFGRVLFSSAKRKIFNDVNKFLNIDRIMKKEYEESFREIEGITIMEICTRIRCYAIRNCYKCKKRWPSIWSCFQFTVVDQNLHCSLAHQDCHNCHKLFDPDRDQSYVACRLPMIEVDRIVSRIFEIVTCRELRYSERRINRPPSSFSDSSRQGISSNPLYSCGGTDEILSSFNITSQRKIMSSPSEDNDNDLEHRSLCCEACFFGLCSWLGSYNEDIVYSLFHFRKFFHQLILDKNRHSRMRRNDLAIVEDIETMVVSLTRFFLYDVDQSRSRQNNNNNNNNNRRQEEELERVLQDILPWRKEGTLIFTGRDIEKLRRFAVEYKRRSGRSSKFGFLRLLEKIETKGDLMKLLYNVRKEFTRSILKQDEMLERSENNPDVYFSPRRRRDNNNNNNNMRREKPKGNYVRPERRSTGGEEKEQKIVEGFSDQEASSIMEFGRNLVKNPDKYRDPRYPKFSSTRRRRNSNEESASPVFRLKSTRLGQQQQQQQEEEMEGEEDQMSTLSIVKKYQNVII